MERRMNLADTMSERLLVVFKELAVDPVSHSGRHVLDKLEQLRSEVQAELKTASHKAIAQQHMASGEAELF
jgi:hypothetical protein